MSSFRALLPSVAIATTSILAVTGLTAVSARAQETGGISFGNTYEQTLEAMSSSARGQVMTAMYNDGVRWVRIDTQNATAYEAIIESALAANLNVDAIIDPDGSLEPQDLASEASAIVTKYAPQGVNTYEVLNEENLNQPNQAYQTPQAYTAILQKVYPAIHAADSGATVLMGSLGPAANSMMTPADCAESSCEPYTYLQGVYDDGGKKFFDAVGIHPYSAPLLPLESDPSNPWQYIPMGYPTSSCAGIGSTDCLHSIMAMNRDGAKKLWITETGAQSPLSAGTGAASQGFQAEYITQAFQLANSVSYSGPAVFNYLWADDEPSVQSVPAGASDYYGLVTSTGVAKLAYTAFGDAVAGTATKVTLTSGHTLQGSSDQRLTNPDSGSELIMQDDGNLVLYDAEGRALWSTQTSGSGNVATMTMAGNLTVTSSAGAVLWSSSNAPSAGATLFLQESAGKQLVIKNASGTSIWNSGV